MQLTFDQVFKIWMDNEVGQVEGRDILPLAREKGFSSVTEWRLATALRLRMDSKEWRLEKIDNPGDVLPQVIIGPYQGWSKFFENQLTTSFVQALEIPEFLEWCGTHNRVVPLSRNFPLPTTVILCRTPDNRFIHIEGGHRICAVAYANKIGKPIDFGDKSSVTAAIADIEPADIERMKEFLKKGTSK